MDYLFQLLSLASVILLACMSPGPDFIAVSSAALSNRRAGVLMGLGVAAGCVAWALLAMLGLGIILTQVGWFYSALRFMGAGYLVFLGGRMLLSIRHASDPLTFSCLSQNHGNAFRCGLFVNIANPKAAVFFGSLFVTILPAGAPFWVYTAIIAVVGGVATGWFVVLALMFSTSRIRTTYDRIRRPIDVLMGTALVGLGAKLAMSHSK